MKIRPFLPWAHGARKGQVTAKSRTLSMFRDDRLLFVLFLGLTLSASLPLFQTPFVPLVDMGSHIGAAAMLDDILLGRETAARFYEINWSPTPYWGAYFILGLAEALGGVFFATKAMVLVNIVILPWALLRLLVALDRSPRQGLVAFLVVWDVNMMWGWVACSLGIALALYVVARLIEVERPRDAIGVAWGTACVALTHIHGLAVLGTLGIAVAIFAWKSRTIVITRLAALLAGTLVIAPWFARFFERSGSVATKAYEFQTASLPDRLGRLYQHTYGYFPQEWAEAPTGIAFLVLLLFPVVLGGFAERPSSPRTTGLALLIVSGLLGLYLFLPRGIIGPTTQVYTYQRLAPAFLVALTLISSARLDGRRVLLLAPPVIAALALHVTVARQAREYRDNVRAYLDIIAEVPEGSRILPLDLEMNDPALPQWGAAGQLHGWLAGAKSAYDPHLFAFDYMPVRYKEPRPPYPDWSKIGRGRIDLEALHEHYDYAIVFPLARDPLLAKDRPKHVLDAGRWRLYALSPSRVRPREEAREARLETTSEH